ncbi:MAG: hypothetical protein MUF52_03715 [Syntrophobacteraceae bacterium]|jgi:hypothetical protein|nr:hypothetical protein [Syntrophobacteraceae bacterium]
MKSELKLVITVDVEEEGLFSGRYPQVPPGVRSVRELGRLEPVSRELGLPLTLLVTHPVAVDPECGRILDRWRRQLGAEIGAHLHPWCTPPFADLAWPEPVPSDFMPRSLLKAKLESLAKAIESRWGEKPEAFRMGRFDLGPAVRRLLPDCGFRVDSSIVPCRFGPGAADHFLAGNEPFWWDEEEMGGSSLLEAPLTQVALWPGLGACVYRAALGMVGGGRYRLLSIFRTLGVVGIQPAWFPLASMRWAVRLHHARGGRVLVMFLHSTELLAGATPDYPTEASVRRLTWRIRAFLQWLAARYAVEGVTLSRLHASMPPARDLPNRIARVRCSAPESGSAAARGSPWP